MPHGVDGRQCVTHMYNFELDEEWHINSELELTFNVVSVCNVPILFEDLCISIAYRNVLLKIFFLPHPRRHDLCRTH